MNTVQKIEDMKRQVKDLELSIATKKGKLEEITKDLPKDMDMKGLNDHIKELEKEIESKRKKYEELLEKFSEGFENERLRGDRKKTE